jgi:hypothetical protein
MEKVLSHAQYIRAESGWLALFEDRSEDELVVRAEPVIAWCLTNGGPDTDHEARSRAVIAAQPWLDRAPHEDQLHCFAVVREDQLEPSFVAELKASNRCSREEILEAGRESQDRRRTHRSHSHSSGVLRVI